jgi:carboxyl-terminal processing protease
MKQNLNLKKSRISRLKARFWEDTFSTNLRNLSFNAIWIIICLYFFSSYTLAAVSSNTKEKEIPLADLQRFTTVVEHIKNYYVNPVSDSSLFDSAVRGMLAGLDPHSAYLDKEEFTDLKVSTSGKFGGLGIEVTLEDGFIRVISPIDGTPADRAGLLAGDLIVRLNDTPVKGLSLKEAVEIMRGKPCEEIILFVIREGLAKPLKVKVVRDIIVVQSVHSKLIEDQFGYIRISQFQNDSGD